MSDGGQSVEAKPEVGVSQGSVGNGSVGREPSQEVLEAARGVREVLAAAAASEDKPERCESCGKREPEVLTTTPTHKSRAGLPLPIWLCAVCEALVPRPKPQAKPKKKTDRRRRSAGRYGEAVMALAYKYGGFTAEQLGQLMLLENPERFEAQRKRGEEKVRKEIKAREASPVESIEELGTSSEGESAYYAAVEDIDSAGKAAAGTAAFKAAADTLRQLKKNKYMLSIGVWRRHAVGERGGRPEEFYYLDEPGVLLGARKNGVVDAVDAKTAYAQHQLPLRPEHSAYRNDIFIRMLQDFDLRRIEERGDPTDTVESGVADFWGESWKGHPYKVGKLPEREWSTKRRRKRENELLYPDGHPALKWADGLTVGFDFESERESWATEGANKVDRYGAFWLRIFKEAVEVAVSPDLEPLEKELAWIRERRKHLTAIHTNKEEPRARREEAIDELEGENERASDKNLKAHEEMIEAVKANPPRGMAFPAEVSPVIFVHQTRVWSEGVRKKLRAREYPMGRYDELVDYVIGIWELDRRVINRELRGSSRAEISQEVFAAEVRRTIDSLFIFTSWEELRRGAKDALDEGGTLATPGIFRSLAHPDDGTVTTTLRGTAELRANYLHPEKMLRAFVDARDGSEEEADETISEPPPEPYYPDDEPGNDEEPGDDEGLIRRRRR